MVIHLIRDTDPYNDNYWYATTTDGSRWSKWFTTVHQAINSILINYNSSQEEYLLGYSIQQILDDNSLFILLPYIDTDLVRSETDLKHYYPEYFI